MLSRRRSRSQRIQEADQQGQGTRIKLKSLQKDYFNLELFSWPYWQLHKTELVFFFRSWLSAYLSGEDPAAREGNTHVWDEGTGLLWGRVPMHQETNLRPERNAAGRQRGPCSLSIEQLASRSSRVYFKELGQTQRKICRKIGEQANRQKVIILENLSSSISRFW